MNRGAAISGTFIMQRRAADRSSSASEGAAGISSGANLHVVNIPAGVKHWHGAASDSWFAHLAVEVPGVETRTEWCEPVSDVQYAEAEHAD